MLGRSLAFDTQPRQPEWVVEPIIEKDTVVLFTGDSGAGKSIICVSMILAIIRGERWCGYETVQGRVLYIDNENHARLVDRRLRMFGFTPEDHKSLQYKSRLGVQLGAGAWLEQALAEIEAFEPSLIVLDTLGSTTTMTTSDNDSIIRTYATVLRPLASASRALLVLHHERKPTPNMPRDARNAALGGVHLRTQADTMLTVERKGEPMQHGRTKRFPVLLTMPKNRDGETMNLPLDICSDHVLNDRGVWDVTRGWIERRDNA